MDERKYRLLIEAGFSKKIVDQLHRSDEDLKHVVITGQQAEAVLESIIDHLSEFQDAYACRTPLQKTYYRISNAISRLFY